jgi:hypothetical protein
MLQKCRRNVVEMMLKEAPVLTVGGHDLAIQLCGGGGIFRCRDVVVLGHGGVTKCVPVLARMGVARQVPATKRALVARDRAYEWGNAVHTIHDDGFVRCRRGWPADRPQHKDDPATECWYIERCGRVRPHDLR